MDKVPNARIRELCGVTKGMDERTEEGVLGWFGHVERMENECSGSRSVSMPKDCLKKSGFQQG